MLAGPPAVGHNTIAELLASGRNRAAVIDNDDVRAMMIKPGATLGAGDEWDRQYELSIRNVCSLARNFAQDGTDAFIVDVVEPEAVPIFRSELSTISSLKIILLTADPEVLIERDLGRGDGVVDDQAALTAWHDRIRHLHQKLSSQAGLYDHCLDSSGQRPEETARAVEQLLGDLP